MDTGREKRMINKIKSNIGKYFIGKDGVVENVLICLLAGGHILIEDVPGLGKTTLTSVTAKSIKSSFGRIQCTPDVLPSDITGFSVYNQKTGEFDFCEGVVSNQILLVDEINRATPKTQSALLEAMAEGQVTVDGNVHKLPELFMVIATQNPSEYIGTYPLPEAQMDRFMMCISVGYPDRDEEMRIAKNMLEGIRVTDVDAVCSVDDILNLRSEVDKVSVNDAVLTYIVDIIRATREEERFVTGASPRAMKALVKASMAKAFIEGRNFVKPDDVKAVVRDVLLHRFSLTAKARCSSDDVRKIFDSIVVKVKVPM